jgi:hypothetical protein
VVPAPPPQPASARAASAAPAAMSLMRIVHMFGHRSVRSSPCQGATADGSEASAAPARASIQPCPRISNTR